MRLTGADMGIQDRDYYREGPSFLDRVGEQGATVWLIAITCGVFVGQLVSGVERSPLVEIGEYDPERILAGEVWRLLTAVFLHGGLWHIFFNMFALYWAGLRIEELRGAREFTLFYLASGIGANLVYLAVYLAGLCPRTQAIGASGAVVAVLVVFACYYPRQRLLLFMVIPIPAWGLVALFVGLDLYGALGGNGRIVGKNVAFIVHLGGAALGLLYYQSGIQFSRLFARTAVPRVRPKLRVHTPPEQQVPEPVGVPAEPAARPAKPADEQLEAKLDAVLEKVSKYGQESLSAEEREILFRASELYKKRRK